MMSHPSCTAHTDVVRELLQALPQLSMTVDSSNTTALNTAATQGHMDVVRLLLEVDGSLALIARSNGKTALHSAARNGHLEVVRALLEAEPSIALRTDKKGQTALHMATKGTGYPRAPGWTSSTRSSPPASSCMHARIPPPTVVILIWISGRGVCRTNWR